MQTTQNTSQCQTPLPLTLFIGGTRSGKSALAEEYATWCVTSHALPKNAVLYLATAEACDASMQNRIKRHQAQRPEEWQTAEIPLYLAKKLSILLHSMVDKPKVILLDCVTLWLSNILFELEKNCRQNANEHIEVQSFEEACLAEITAFFDVIQKHQDIEWILVSGETGLGGIGASHLERVFQDGLGLVNQHIARAAKQRFFCVAGCALPLSLERPWLCV